MTDPVSLAKECLRGSKSGAITPNQVYTYVELPFACWCDFHAPAEEKRPPDRFQLHLMETGKRHERDLAEDRHPDAEPLEGETDEERFMHVLAGMAGRTPAVLGGPLFYLPEGLWGRLDIIERVDDGASVFGDYHYVVKEVKSAIHIAERHRLQTACYNHLLGKVQGFTPSTYYVIDGNREEHPFDYDEDEVLEVLEAIRAIRDGHHQPPPVYGGTDGGWSSYTNRQAVERNDASLLQDIGPSRREQLEAAGFSTVDDVLQATPADLQEVHGVGPKRAEKLKTHAEALDAGHHVQIGDVDLPAADVEVFVDLEGTANNPYEGVQQDIDYLIGCLVRDGASGADADFVPFVASDLDSEEAMFHGFTGWLGDLADDVKVYHWANYEKWRFERMAKRYGVSPPLRRKLFDNLVDLHPIATNAFVFPTYGNSIKAIAPYMGFAWRYDDVSGTEAIAMYYEYVEDPEANEDLLQKVVDYNEDDCRATMVVKDWLEEHGGGA